jgi:hypothetical protein
MPQEKFLKVMSIQMTYTSVFSHLRDARLFSQRDWDLETVKRSPILL